MPNDHSLLVWVLDRALGLLKSCARTAEQEQAVDELRTLALLPKPDTAKIESLVHRLETMGSITPEPQPTHLPPKRAGVIEARPVRITLDHELNRLIESIGKKTGAKRTPGKKTGGKKPARKVAPKKPTRKVAPRVPAAAVGGKKPAVKARAKKTTARAARKKTAIKGGGKKTATPKNFPTKKTRG